MGKLSIEGKAEREVSYNAVEISVKFYTREKNTAKALQTVIEQSERFLELITEAGVELENIYIGDNSLEQRYNDNKINVSATREVTIRLQFDMKYINGLMDLIREQDFSASIDCDYHLTNYEEIHTELLQEALDASRQQAEIIANMMGQKIVGIESVEHDRYGNVMYRGMARKLALPCKATPLSNQLKAPLTTESESISVVWLIE